MPIQQQKIRSEYAKSFKTYRESAQTEYSENMKFRRARRNQEVTHQPWAWLDVGISEDESESEAIRTASGVRSSGPQVGKHRSENEAADMQSTDTNSDFDASGTVDMYGNSAGADERLMTKLKNRALQRAAELQAQTSDEQQNQSNSGLRRPHHPLKGSANVASATRLPVSKPAQESTSKPRKDLRSINRDKMFLAYGWGSRSNEASRKETFNIKSDIDVKPSATRAMRSRQNLLKLQQQRGDKQSGATGPASARLKTAARSAGGPHSARSARTIDLDNRAAMEWLSEYQLRFPIYDNEVYRRGLANLAPRGHSARLEGPRTCRI